MVLLIHQIPQSPFTGVRGWLSLDEDEKLIELSKRFNVEGAVLVNSGVEYGRSISLLAKFAPLATVWGVELSPKVDYYPQMKAAKLNPTIIVGNALEVAKNWALPIDFAFIDDDHSLNHLRIEIPLWTQHIKVGGVIAFHDAAPETNLAPHWLHVEVQQALNEWQEADGDKWIELQSADSIRVFERIAK